MDSLTDRLHISALTEYREIQFDSIRLPLYGSTIGQTDPLESIAGIQAVSDFSDLIRICDKDNHTCTLFVITQYSPYQSIPVSGGAGRSEKDSGISRLLSLCITHQHLNIKTIVPALSPERSLSPRINLFLCSFNTVSLMLSQVSYAKS